MFEDLLDIVDKFAKDNNLVLVGILLLVLAFVLSFCYKTFWCQWNDRAKEKGIYGEPRGKRSHLLRDNKTDPPENETS